MRGVGGVVCSGLACVDMRLYLDTGGGSGESIETFKGEVSMGGGSVSMATKTLARLHHGPPPTSNTQNSPPVLNKITPLCKIGNDSTGAKLISLLEETSPSSKNVSTKYLKSAQTRDPTARTALAVLPIYQDGRRGCFFDAASNDTFSNDDLLAMMEDLVNDTSSSLKGIGAFIFGYPHLLPQLQGDKLASLFQSVKSNMVEGGILVLDLNGVPDRQWDRMRLLPELKQDPVIGPALDQVDILHLNEEELVSLTGCQIEGCGEDTQLDDEFQIASACNLFLMCGVAVVAVTRGAKGCFISCADEARFRKSPALPPSWVDCTTKFTPAELPPGTVLNTNGAGDAFTAGLALAALLRHTGVTVPQRTSQGRDVNESKAPAASSSQFVDEVYDSDLSELKEKIPPIASKKKATPYSLYMKEHYISLKAQCNDDKKAIFTKCHDMWENESPEVKALYERKCAEDEKEQQQQQEQEQSSPDELVGADEEDGTAVAESSPSPPPLAPVTADTTTTAAAATPGADAFMRDRSLNLESAAQFASLVASHHIDVSTRDERHLDVTVLLERAMIFPHGLEEI